MWAILPHAARTFSACIAMMPRSSALASAVGYLYCRMLDTYEDLVPWPDDRDAALAAFGGRFGPGAPGPAPAIGDSNDRDERDRAHLLLVRKCALVDAAFMRLDPTRRALVADLVRDMAEGMRWASRTFAAQGGVLDGPAQLTEYCGHVLGNPVVFTVRLLRVQHGAEPELSADELRDAMAVGEFVQLANVTRDVEKDLCRGVAYDAALRAHLGTDGAHADVAAARRRFTLRAFELAPSYARMVAAMRLPRWSVARSAAVLMLLFTERHYRRMASRCGLAAWDGPDRAPSLFVRTFAACFSRRLAERQFARVAGAMAASRAASGPAEAGTRDAPRSDVADPA